MELIGRHIISWPDFSLKVFVGVSCVPFLVFHS
jgi:hypothetical protein